MSDDENKLDTKSLDNLVKALVGNLPNIKIGILGGGGRADSNGISNAEVGSFHEFGTAKMPKRSFLKEPLADNLDNELMKSGAFDKRALDEVVKSKSVTPWLEKVAIVAQGIVLEAFASNGYGKWPGWGTGYKSKTGQILVDTQQLRNSITYEIK